MLNQPINYVSLDEWKEARSVVARFDNNLDDLRKYGFTFVTAILAANGLISFGGSSVMPNIVKTGILIVTVGLIVTLRILDIHYRCFQEIAVTRARLLEYHLNLDLTNDISHAYDVDTWWKKIEYLYDGFLGLTIILGVAILWDSWLLLTIAIIAAVSAFFLMRKIDCGETKSRKFGSWDWSIDRKIIPKGTPLRIMYTNLKVEDKKNPRDILLVWAVKEASNGIILTKTNSEYIISLEDNSLNVNPTKLGYFETKDWLWETTDKKPGLYDLIMCEGEKDQKTIRAPIDKTLKFKIQVTQP